MIRSVTKFFDFKEDPNPKPHSNATLMVAYATYITYLIFPWADMTDKVILIPFIIVALATVAYYAYAIKQWHIFIKNRRSGRNKDRNIFFAESAGKVRKGLFFISILLYFFVMNKISELKEKTESFDVVFRSDFNALVSFTVIETFLFIIVFVESLKIMFPATDSWSTKKNITVIIAASILFSTVRYFGLSLIDHNIM